jgi:hypothetical protein
MASAAMTAKPLLRILASMLALAAECNVNGQAPEKASNEGRARKGAEKRQTEGGTIDAPGVLAHEAG